MRVVILGCGRVGARLAMMLDQQGHQVSIIDQRSDSFSRLDPNFRGQAIVGNGIDVDVLRQAGIDDADAFAAVTNSDNTNAMAAQISKHIFRVDQAICRMYDPVRDETYRLLGLRTVCPTTAGAQRIKELLDDYVRRGVRRGQLSPGDVSAQS
ncbi:MAG TPA: TrkA family potassium uptake protein [Chloroflexota bacterium]|nr:TrkA family potassium uptake protein [Chloroflexota bacterium]